MSNIGDRVQLVHTDDPDTDLVRGDEGTVDFIDHIGTVFVKWDSGSKRGLIPGADAWQNVG
jgi:hypothetical protein